MDNADVNTSGTLESFSDLRMPRFTAEVSVIITSAIIQDFVNSSGILHQVLAIEYFILRLYLNIFS